MLLAGTLPWLNTSILNVTVSPGYTLESSPAAKVFLNAKSKISRNTFSGSLSSSSPFSLSTVSSVFESTTPPASFVKLSSGVESISVGLSPNSSVASLISSLMISS